MGGACLGSLEIANYVWVRALRRIHARLRALYRQRKDVHDHERVALHLALQHPHHLQSVTAVTYISRTESHDCDALTLVTFLDCLRQLVSFGAGPM